jgi:hypothetical protein
MQKRKLNERREFDIEIAEGMNITSNFYPVTSAIAIRDENLQMTVSNSHSQAGSSIKEGRIELVQHRTTYDNDNRGVDESLYDVDQQGNPIPVHATYHVQLFDFKREKSTQREV